MKPAEAVGIDSRVAQWKRAGPITQRSVDRNHALLMFFFAGVPPEIVLASNPRPF